jgi:hypothetical protein
VSDGESESERLDRNLMELLNELRLALPGVQVLFAFLLILPFSTGFSATTKTQRDVYACALIFAVLASVFFIAPSSYHRHGFVRLHRISVPEKREMLLTQDRLAVAGFVFLTLSVLSAVFVVISTLFGAAFTAIALAGLAGLGFAFVGFWCVLPLSRRLRASPRS